MTAPDLSPLVGTVLLDDVRVVAVVRQDETLALLHARRDGDGSPCTVCVACGVELRDTDVELAQGAIARMARHAVGIRALAAPLGAGAVRLDGARRLFVVHRGDALEPASARIAAGPSMSLADVVRLLTPVAEAIGVLHDQGLVHGAVIPSALQLGSSGPVLSLFGWREAGSVIGGPAMARDLIPPSGRTPEQVALVPAAPGPAGDTYGLAMIAAQLLAGKPLATIDPAVDVARIIDNPMVRPTPRALGADVPDAVESAFAAALATQPRERTSDPRAFVAALSAPPQASNLAPEPEPVLEPEPFVEPAAPAAAPAAHPRPTSHFVPPPVPPPPSSNAWLVYALVGFGALLLLGGAAAGFYLALTRPAPPPAATTASPAIPPPPVVPPPATRPPRLTVPGPTDTFPDAGEDDGTEQQDEGDDSADAAVPGVHVWDMRPDAGATATWPDDATALIPIGAHTPVIGSRDALVTIVLFADLKCPYTLKARRLVEREFAAHPSEVRVAVRLLPMPDNAGSAEAARVGAAVALTTDAYSFWHFFELVSEQGKDGPTDREGLERLAEQAGASSLLLDKKLQDRTVALLLDEDRSLAGRLMVHATPTWFINGRRFNGVLPWATLDGEVGQEIVAAKNELHHGVAQSKLYATRVLFNVTAGSGDREEQPEE